MDGEHQSAACVDQSESSDGSTLGKIDHIGHTRKLLGRQMLVGIKDGRFFLGSFYCMDKQGNIILQDAVEYRSIRNSPSPMEQRGLGLILIPFSCRISCHVDCCSIEEQLSLLSLQEQNPSI